MPLAILPAILGALVLALAVLGVTFVIGMRTKSPIVLGPLVALSKAVMNPRQMRTAGTPGAFAGIIRHRGRRTGTAYATPVGVLADGDDFLIVLVYGNRTQWLRNVLAAGEAVLVTEGRTWQVTRPEIIPTLEVADRLGPSDQFAMRVLGTRECLRLRRVVEVPDEGDQTIRSSSGLTSVANRAIDSSS